MDRRTEISNNIALLIKSSGKNQTQIAQELNVNKTTVSEYVNGGAIPTTLTLIKLCQVLDCEYEEILGKP